MKRITIAFIIVICCTSASRAQFKQIAEGPEFKELEEGFAKIIQLKNGNTLFLYITHDDPFSLRIYDAAHTEIAVAEIKPGFDRVRHAGSENKGWEPAHQELFEAVFAINNDLVIFINEKDRKKSILYRMIIDGTTGITKEESIIASMSRFARFMVQKDLLGDNYAVVSTEWYDAFKLKEQRLRHFGADHKEISNNIIQTSISLAANQYSKWDMIVFGTEKTVAFCSNGTGADYIYIEQPGQGVSKLAFIQVEIPAGLISKAALTKYDPVGKRLIRLQLVGVKDKDEYGAIVYFIDPLTLNVEKTIELRSNDKLNEAYKERYDKKEGYTGVPQDFFLHDDGSFTIVSEELTIYYSSTSSASGGGTRVDTRLGKMMISDFDRNGKLLSDYLVPKEGLIVLESRDILYHSSEEGGLKKLHRGNQFKFFGYFDNGKERYILFNDTERNNEVTRDKFAEVRHVIDCDAFMYKLTGSDIFPVRKYAFGANAKEHTIALFTVSEYDKKTNTLVTLKQNTSVSKKMVRLVWVQPE